MPTEKFDAYGEILPAAARESSSTASAVLSRIGQFICYPATPAFDVGSATALKQTAAR
jgi:hypothetical protein